MGRAFKLVVAFCLWSALIAPGSLYGGATPNLDDAVAQARELKVSDTTVNRVMEAVTAKLLLPEDGAELLGMVNSAAREQLPANWLAEKIDEGLTKHVPAHRIKAALSAKIDDFRFVRGLIREKYPETASHPAPGIEDIYALAETLSMGLDREELASFWRSSPPAPIRYLLIATENLALLKQTGYDPELTRRVLAAGIEAQAFNPTWRYYPRAVAAARQKGISDQEIYQTSISVIAAKGSPRDVLAKLGFTGRNMVEGPTSGLSAPSSDKEPLVEEEAKTPEN